MNILPKSIRKLIEELSRLPGIGPKSASRLAFYLLKSKDFEREQLAKSVSELKHELTFCQQCHNLAESALCAICSDKNRKQNLICVVEEPLDVVALEQGRNFQGTYHVLGGVISPIDGIGPDNLKIRELLERIMNLGEKSEIIIATNPSLEGEGTAMYVAKRLKSIPNVRITRIAHGLPMGGDIEYADELTITKAMEGRRDYGIN
ncbi:MAG: recombination protein RecR [Candidatus Doudnabacteria bacterium RIFCSPHIGHO2_02_FULL_48_21]|uniref:Recombination protein RecR n=1 Tax=Candidatus Doudnabacteria bacterium RIFCSPLOWO2_02_FULL_48_13 TaxID=1817845 RepID=A0A1F5QA97_9BACT|nr:MAG: recombination protein RecR [Candidatus Doudnabacteria bacterium RIFCSPHIGHO2_01_48_18]OGE79593.1 MAG: recombination protein RecR [Candidatus Doudnabacteria bacterium RIFCSPHIGHO2_01_FULL_48_180]OGE91120.1 MAG: recombination protein RecR [Candidatus Doudnabacteria bacterium RIFCSPHIGHO2_12_FULL_47_25]OGE93810.1 MAG: recombination protein RecR [Candidatus Doudnabacteria bacterium RIFCSPHIGHO2_02_FULL_48_21]OGE97996.1 MAG: recombination protein RecR [Candidatus Doudnabacteria bacterium RIF